MPTSAATPPNLFFAKKASSEVYGGARKKGVVLIA